MTTSVDSNVFIALWNPDDSTNSRASERLEFASQAGGLVISAPVYSELLAYPGREERVIEQFIVATGIVVDWVIDERVWREASRAFRNYSIARRKQRQPPPRRILTDFVIGAHAVIRNHRLLTMDKKIYRAAFPSLDVISL
jgi:predicted nucleic acid-binding protein